MVGFLADAWLYGPHTPLRVLKQLPEGLLGEAPMRLVERLRSGGGKALGLSMCDEIAHHAPHMHVPAWFSLSVADQMRNNEGRVLSWCDANPGSVKVRSSTTSEDWLSGKSGVHDSRTIDSPDKILKHALEISKLRFPVVVQQLAEGIGIVADVVWSPILGRVVVRMSTGRAENRGAHGIWYTSATWDHEGRHEVYDPQTGDALLDPCHGKLFEGECLHLPLDAVAQELWRALTVCGINFGIQAEIIIHPDHPEIWHLVQIRPSPDRVRLHALSVSAVSSPLLTTPAVSCAFAHAGMATLVDQELARTLMLHDANFMRRVDPDLAERFHRGPILVWEQDPHDDFNLYQLEAAHAHGALVQITRRVITVSTSHGTIHHRLEAEQESLVARAGILAIPDTAHATIVATLKESPRFLQAVSDGIVGQVALI